MRRLTRPLLILLAIVFLIEAWLWSHLEPIVAWIVARIPLRALKARLRGGHRAAAAGWRRCSCSSCRSCCCCRSSSSACGCWRKAHWFARRLDAGAGQARQHGRHRLHLRGDAAEAAAAGLVPLALRARAWPGSPGRTPGRSDQGADRRRCCACSGRSAPAARCGCSGASAAACGRNAGASLPLRTDAPRAARAAVGISDRHEGEPEQCRGRRPDRSAPPCR